MLIHQDSATFLDQLYWCDIWQYTYESGGNFVLIHFSVPTGYIPKTGDKILKNKLIKQREDE